MWMIPLITMAIAMLACDDIVMPSVMVDRVEADQFLRVDGKVYVIHAH